MTTITHAGRTYTIRAQGAAYSAIRCTWRDPIQSLPPHYCNDQAALLCTDDQGREYHRCTYHAPELLDQLGIGIPAPGTIRIA